MDVTNLKCPCRKKIFQVDLSLAVPSHHHLPKILPEFCWICNKCTRLCSAVPAFDICDLFEILRTKTCDRKHDHSYDSTDVSISLKRIAERAINGAFVAKPRTCRIVTFTYNFGHFSLKMCSIVSLDLREELCWRGPAKRVAVDDFMFFYIEHYN